MLRNRIWYHLKPFLPRELRLRLRRWHARARLRRFSDTWPILPGSHKPPPNWPGWPGGKKFAFVLTHDVEGFDGLSRCERLMELERSMGFRSSFNFIPEGEYHLSPMLRDTLDRNGFEVGVHDLHHDGHLFRSREHFRQAAQKVNQYLREWNAVGFRAGFMLRRLEWLHDLDILYDASTFDTDPFEPMPDGAGMIFPFWVTFKAEGDNSGEPNPVRGYVELPYTLVQDSTLFLLLEQNSPEMWLRKLDWIAQHGGMALVNVHPDYLRFPDEEVSPFTFPVEHYQKLLAYVAEKYAGQYWHALPRDVARFVRNLPHPPLHRRPLRVAMVTHSVYMRDNRIIRYAEALRDAGHDVEVLSLRPQANMPRSEQVRGVRVIRLANRFTKDAQGIWSVAYSSLYFLMRASWHLAVDHRRRPYDLLHVHNLPDFLVVAASYPRLRGARVILDIHDLLPEFFCSRFGTSESSIWFRLLAWIEKVSAHCADHVIISNHLWQPRYEARTGTAGRCSVFINHVNTELYRPELRAIRNGSEGPLLIFPGGLQEHQGLDIAIRALPQIRKRYPQVQFHVYGDGPMRKPWEELARSLGLSDVVTFHAPIPAHEIAVKMAEADVGVVPKRADSFGNEAYSTKIMEFMALGVPVVVSETRIDRYYFNDSLVRFFPSGDSVALAQAVIEVLEDKETTRARVARAQAYALAESWQVRKGDYLALVDRLCSRAKHS
ncbi:MAG: glycosyltransferase [Limisphaera sp.]|nr:glycosyltransferase [Limisphaera sp.]